MILSKLNRICDCSQFVKASPLFVLAFVTICSSKLHLSLTKSQAPTTRDTKTIQLDHTPFIKIPIYLNLSSNSFSYHFHLILSSLNEHRKRTLLAKGSYLRRWARIMLVINRRRRNISRDRINTRQLFHLDRKSVV